VQGFLQDFTELPIENPLKKQMKMCNGVKTSCVILPNYQ